MLRCQISPSSVQPDQFTPKEVRERKHVSTFLVTCVDFRLREEVCDFMKRKGLEYDYDEVVLPGASLGAINPHDSLEIGGAPPISSPGWQKSFFSQLELIVNLHKIEKVILMDHLHCDFYKSVFGDKYKKSTSTMKAYHCKHLHITRKMIKERFPKLSVDLFLMDLSGKVYRVSEKKPSPKKVSKKSSRKEEDKSRREREREMVKAAMARPVVGCNCGR